MADPELSGNRFPAEWEAHEATWLSWPHNEDDWPGKLGAVEWAYAEIVRKLAPGERLHIAAQSPEVAARGQGVLARAGIAVDRVRWFPFPSDRGWMRDIGPMFVHRAGELAVARFRFNGWGKYPNWHEDDRMAERAAQALGLPLLPMRHGNHELVLEGGSFDVNGRGTVITTEECLLDQKEQPRNPGLGRKAMEAALAASLGGSNVLWLGRGIDGDDTHGHVDDLCRFVGPGTVVLASEEDASDVNHQALGENRERLTGMRLEDGSRLEVVPLPMPDPLHFDGLRLPASYANFYIGNGVVLVPTFNDRHDRQALGILAELFPDRQVIGIHAVDLVWGFGTLHCLTQQQPRASAVRGTAAF